MLVPLAARGMAATQPGALGYKDCSETDINRYIAEGLLKPTCT